MRFDFATATQIIFGPGTLREAAPLAKSFGRRALVVSGLPWPLVAPLTDSLARHDIAFTCFPVEGEPEVGTIQSGVARAREFGSDVVLGIGGGSALDTGKAIAAMLANDGELLDHLEVIGRGRALTCPSLPLLAIPTTAGTGAEVTRNAVLASPEHRVKVSLRSAFMLPRVALVDPELTHALPPAVTASTGLDALTQVIEPYVSARANPMVDALCVEGIRRAARSLRVAFREGHNAAAREDMALTSLFGGLALANAGLGAAHGFAGPIGGGFPAPHGAVCAALLPPVMRVNIQALRQRQPHSSALRRYEELARLLTGRSDAQPEDGASWVASLAADLRIPSLAAYGITQAHLAELVAKAAQASSMKANPIVLTIEELTTIIELAL